MLQFRRMESAIDEVKKKLDIVSFLGHYIHLKKAGRNFKANCPFHQEKTPSFVVSPERQIWHCFGSCGDGGDIIKFLMKWEGITFSEALVELAHKAGVALRDVKVEDREWQIKQRYLQINTLAAEFFEYLLQTSDIGKKGRDYLENRGVPLSLAKKFQLGYAPSSWHSLLTFMRKKNFRDEELYNLGFVVKNDAGHYYDRFRGRLMFPIKDTRGAIVGFSGRLLSSEAGEAAKYINSPETPLYHKRETLFGIHLAKEAIKKAGNALVVEGEFDMISPFQHGIEQVVAIKGSAVTREQLLLLRRYTSRITLALDSDAAGEEAVRRIVEEADETDMEINVVHFEKGKDPDEAVRADTIHFKKQLEKPLLVYDFVIQFSQKKYPGNDAYSKKKIGDEVLPFLMRIKNPIIQSHYTKKVAELLEVSEESIQAIMKKLRFVNKPKRSFTRQATLPPAERGEVLQKYLLSIMFQHDTPYEVSHKVFAVLQVADFLIPALQKILEKFFSYEKNNPEKFILAEFVATLPSELRPVFDEVYLFSSTDLQIADTNIDRLILDVKRSTLKKKISQLLHEGASEENHEEELLTLTTSLKQVEKQSMNV